MMNRYSYTFEWDKKYCYKGSHVLINKLNIQEEEILEEAERKITSVKILSAKLNPIQGNFDFAHLKKIHKHIFEDIYTWAGETRTVNITKGSEFCLWQNIDLQAEKIFAELESEALLKSFPLDQLSNRLAYYLGELNAIHPFREGNGRTQRLFVEYLAENAGVSIDYSLTTSEEMYKASAEAFNTNYEPMNQLMEKIIVPE
ncbi:cell filamentation protein [Clostridiales Family XIII bacterium PM5-7]